jgi:hypothetical protein
MTTFVPRIGLPTMVALVVFSTLYIFLATMASL